jgi:hypothetical protein
MGLLLSEQTAGTGQVLEVFGEKCYHAAANHPAPRLVWRLTGMPVPGGVDSQLDHAH